MSGQWEVVGRKRDKGSKLPVPNNKASNGKQDFKKNNLLDGVNISEVLPKSQVQNLYLSNNNKNKENKKTSAKDNANKENINKKQKKPESKNQEAPKPKPPKSIESALNSIDVGEFSSLYEKIKLQFPEGEIVWLKELVQYLNQKIPVDVQDPVFSNKKQGYPLAIIPSNLRAVIEKSVKDVGQQIASVFFGIALTTMATEMSKGSSAIGHKIYLQYIALNDPTLFASGINSNLVTLLNSYQNRPNIGLSILWVVAHNCQINIHSGLKVYKELMLPLIDMKNYSRYVIKYLLDLISSDALSADKSGLSKDEYLLIIDSLFAEQRKNFPNEFKSELHVKVSELNKYFFKSNNDSYKNSFNTFLKKLSNSVNSNSDKTYQKCLCNVLLDIIVKEPGVLFNVWDGLYKNSLMASAVLLNFIANNLSRLNSSTIKKLKELLESFESVNEKLLQKKKKEDGLQECKAAIQLIRVKMVSDKKSRSSLKPLFILLTLLVSTTIYFDIKHHGSWEASNLRYLLKETGICEYAHVALEKGKLGLSYVDARIEENFPDYKTKVAEFNDPYIRLFKNLGIIISNSCIEFKNFVVHKLDVYAPGVVESSQDAVVTVFSSTVMYFNRSVDYLREEVFVGQLSPENMQRVVLEAINSTQQKATEYYHWLYEKVQTTIK